MAISIKKLDERNNVSRYLVKGVSPAFLNAIRRTIMLHTPCLAIEDISIYENDSVMFDEFLAHRLGLLPIKTDKTYKKKDKIKLVLEKEGPCTVYSKDIKSTDPKIEVVDKNIPITRLSKEQKLKVEMQAIMETGKEHVKWQPAVIGYKEVPELVVSKDFNEGKDFAKLCPLGILEVKGQKLVLAKPYECNLCGACVDSCHNDAVKLRFNENSFILIIEPIAGLSVKETIERAAKELIGKSKEFAKALQKVK